MIHYEVHITVDPTNLDRFKSDCKELNLKPLLISLNETDTDTQLMTSNKYSHEGHSQLFWKDLHTELNRISKIMTFEYGYKIQRLKVEINPNSLDSFLLRQCKYLESHLRFKLNKSSEVLFRLFAESNDLHLSKNKFKELPNDEYYQMGTLRTKNLDLKSFMNTLDKISGEVGFLCDKVEIEACILDTNEALDNQWLKTELINT